MMHVPRILNNSKFSFFMRSNNKSCKYVKKYSSSTMFVLIYFLLYTVFLIKFDS